MCDFFVFVIWLIVRLRRSPSASTSSISTMPPKGSRLTDGLETVEMGGEEAAVEIEAAPAEEENGLPFQEEAMDEAPARVTFVDYLRSPVIVLLVGQGDEQALLTAHQSLLVTSPWFAEACARFSDEVSVRASKPPPPASPASWCNADWRAHFPRSAVSTS